MSNKTRAEIQTQIFEYLPQINHTGKYTIVNNCIDAAVEAISLLHDFRSLRAIAPDTATLTAGNYYIDLTSFTIMGAAATYFKDVLQMRWLKATGEDYGVIKFVDDATFHNKWGYIDYASRSRGEPCEYTRLGDRFIFNCPANETLTIRCWYQKMHPPFAADGTSHSFPAKTNMLAFNAIVYGALIELKNSLTSVEFPQEMQAIEARYGQYVQSLIAADRDLPNESVEFGWGERNHTEGFSSPYDWI